MRSHSTVTQPTAQGQFTAYQGNENLRTLNPKLTSTSSCIPTLLCSKEDKTFAADGSGYYPSNKAIFLHTSCGCHVEISFFTQYDLSETVSLKTYNTLE